ncbi:amidohydrolase YhaA [Clostridium aceticum]|uniref:Amidohydrolase YhaA n=1 Tax=Clostridium aceticum TaxID=84022 RepID=A0A0D8I9K3_9CLOT|nr:amidohydrolase [Clostridium aceticum]AKL95727.1 amidohydrolase YhaA [Clostridium aceticum]KJF26722.1 N-acyl-L-amino acid amidohydrolase [Clostridium aceticum]
MNVVNLSKDIQEKIVQWRRALHQIPEIGLETPKTAAYVAQQLEALQIPYQTGVGGFGVVGLIKGNDPGKTIALRADMDGLAIKEETGLPFAATNGNMHACGHDAHTAMLLGAAEILQANRHLIKGNVKLIFQPGEEGPGGAKPMIDDGVLENPKVDSVLGLHIGVLFKEMKPGEVWVSYGNLMACLDSFYVKIKGKGCHGAMPDTGVDPIAITGQVISSLQTIISRELKPTNPGVLTIGKLHGGRAYNIIPEFVEIEGTVRATDQGEREKIAKRIEEIVASITKGMRGDYEYEYTFGYPPLVNDPQFTQEFVETAKKIVSIDEIKTASAPTMGGEDMAYFLERVPGTFFFFGGGNEEKGIIYPHHNPKFDVDEEVFYRGTALLVQGAIDWLEKHQ